MILDDREVNAPVYTPEMVEAWRARFAYAKDQPRHPAGSPQGGEFAPAGGPASGTRAEWDIAPTKEQAEAAHEEFVKDYDARMSGKYTPPDTSAHPVVREGRSGRIWGASHENSYTMAGRAAQIMGIDGYDPPNDSTDLVEADTRNVTKFLSAIANDTVGSEEPLYHAFENVRGTVFRPGDTFKIPLTATSGDIEGYGVRLDWVDQKGEPTVLAFPKGTPMAAYGKWKKSDAKEFGHVYTEAIVAGEFEVVSVERKWRDQPHHDSRPGRTWVSATLTNIVTVRPKRVFDPETKRWVKRG